MKTFISKFVLYSLLSILATFTIIKVYTWVLIESETAESIRGLIGYYMEQEITERIRNGEYDAEPISDTVSRVCLPYRGSKLYPHPMEKITRQEFTRYFKSPFYPEFRDVTFWIGDNHVSEIQAHNTFRSWRVCWREYESDNSLLEQYKMLEELWDRFGENRKDKWSELEAWNHSK